MELFLPAQIRLAHHVAAQEVFARVAVGDLPQFEDVAPVGDLQRFVCVLFDEEDGDALGADVFDDVEDLRNDNRGVTPLLLFYLYVIL